MERPSATVLAPRRLVAIGSAIGVCNVPEADEVHRVFDGFAGAGEEREQKQERGEAAGEGHGAQHSKRPGSIPNTPESTGAQLACQMRSRTRRARWRRGFGLRNG